MPPQIHIAMCIVEYMYGSFLYMKINNYNAINRTAQISSTGGETVPLSTDGFKPDVCASAIYIYIYLDTYIDSSEIVYIIILYVVACCWLYKYPKPTIANYLHQRNYERGGNIKNGYFKY